MIYTLTLNPAIDYKFKLKSIELGGLNRFQKASFQPGGKGINVSIVLSNLGIPNHAIAILGGWTGRYLKECLKKDYHMDIDEISVLGDTRINVKAMVEHETEFNHVGPKVSDAIFESILARIENFDSSDYLIVSGSVPYGQHDAFQQIASLCMKKNIPFIMDTSGDQFHHFIDFKPFLMKPNLKELNDYLLMDLYEIDEIIFYGRQLIYRGVEHLIISLGERGSLYLNQKESFLAQPIVSEVISTTGAGDSMIAGFIAKYIETKDTRQSFIHAVACAQATVFSGRLATKSNIQKYVSKIIIEEL